MSRNCPKCRKVLAPYAVACGCGWKHETEAGVVSGEVNPSLGYVQCDWRAGISRCHYPGSMSTNIGGRGPVYCSAHFYCKSGAEGADIVEASHDYKHPTQEEILAEHQARAGAWCNEKGLDTLEKKREFFRTAKVFKEVRSGS